MRVKSLSLDTPRFLSRLLVYPIIRVTRYRIFKTVQNACRVGWSISEASESKLMSRLEPWYVGCKIRDDFYIKSSLHELSDSIKDDGEKDSTDS